MVKPLTVYKASAGSGKTFTLATEYIRLLVENPTSYRNILAVTFTNKATEEMKMRILSQLYGIWKQLPESADYIKVIQEKTGYGEELISERAGIALQNLLHNYNYFRVETIDTFFQSVLRNLARELELTTNLRIGLNDHQIEDIAVDQLIADLNTTDIVLQWIIRYIMESISDDSSWNVISKIKKFGCTIFQDRYKEVSDELSKKMQEPGFFEHYTTQLRELREAALEHMKQIGESFFDELEAEQLTIEGENSMPLSRTLPLPTISNLTRNGAPRLTPSAIISIPSPKIRWATYCAMLSTSVPANGNSTSQLTSRCAIWTNCAFWAVSSKRCDS